MSKKKETSLEEIVKHDVVGKNKNKLMFQHPCTIQMSGQSGSGKTVFLTSVLLDKDCPWDFVIYCYGAYQKKFDLLKKKLKDDIIFIEGVPKDEDKTKIEEFLKENLKKPPKEQSQVILIFDDLMNEVEKNKYFSKLYYSGCHHLNLSVCTLTQNIFNNRNDRLNFHYLLIFNFEADKSTILNIGRQLIPHNSKKLVEMYNECRKNAYGFLLIDLRCRLMGHPELKYRNSGLDCIFDGSSFE